MRHGAPNPVHLRFFAPGGILFEIAPNAPRFTEDEELEELGLNLRVPSWMEKARAQIGKHLPPIILPCQLTP